MQDLGSFHFHLHHEAGGTELMPQFVIDEAEGDVVSPDQISISFSGSFAARFAIEASLITLGAYSYMTNPLTGQWEAVATGVSPLGFFSPTRGIDAIMSQVEQLYLLENGGRQETYRLGGTVAAEALASLLGPTLEGVDVRAELTIDADSLYLLQVRVLGRVIPSDAEDIVRVITLSAFDEPVSIEAPW